MHKHVVNDTNVYDKSHFLDHEDDTDNIDDFIAETPHDIMFTKAIYEENEDLFMNNDNVEFNAREKIKNIIDSVKDEEMSNHLRKWMYKYTNVFNDELNEKAVNENVVEIRLANAI